MEFASFITYCILQFILLVSFLYILYADIIEIYEISKMCKHNIRIQFDINDYDYIKGFLGLILFHLILIIIFIIVSIELYVIFNSTDLNSIGI